MPVDNTLTPSPQLAEALRLHQAGRLQEAEAVYARILTRQPGNFLARYHQGLAKLQRGELESGVRALEQAVKLKPDHPQARYDLGRALGLLGRHAQALQHFERLVALQPELAEARFYLGLTLAQLKRPADALPHLQEAARLLPGLPEVWHNLGGVQLELGEAEDAETAFRRALELQPGLAEAHNGLGNALTKLARYDEACTAYKQAILLKPDFFEAFLGWGTALREMGQHKAARAAYDQALALRPEDPEAHGLLGKLYKEMGNSRQAIEHLKRALAGNDRLVDVHCDLGGELYLWGRYDEGRAHFERAMALDPTNHGVLSALLFSLHYQPDVPAVELARLHRLYGERFESPLRPGWRPHDNDPNAERPLRVGFVSADFRRHPVGYFMVDVLAALDRSQVHPYLYANQGVHDDFTERFQASAHVWCEVKGMNDDALAERIRQDGIDILVDLSGHTAGERLLVFARKPAPVQVSYLGYFDSTGLTSMDYILGNAWVLPETEVPLYTERPWRLPETHLCYTISGSDVDVGPLPALQGTGITFGCFNKFEKVNDRVAATWARVLAAVPGSRLFLKARTLDDTEVAQMVRERFAAHGVSPERLILEGATQHRAYLERYHQVDIALDPYPYNGGTTTVDALWMGVPTLTLKGDRYVAHMSESILHNIGLTDWIAADEDDYVAKAAAYARDLDKLASLRAQLRQRLLASPLCDAPRFARHLEQAFRGMWRTWCGQRAP
jgi:predicted O-linked N-acetylglucosamine transferase (SPINDLY family)